MLCMENCIMHTADITGPHQTGMAGRVQRTGYLLMLTHQRQQLGNVHVPFRVLQAVKVGQKGSCFVHGVW